MDFQATGVTFWVRSGSNSLQDAYVVLGDDNITLNNGVVFFLASGNGYLILAGPSGTVYKLAPYTCSEWTDGAAVSDGRFGRIDFTTAGWIALGEATCGLSTYHVLCLAWR